MRTTDMNIEHIDGSTFMTILTMGFYVALSITLQSLAGVAAIAAGFSTLLYNLYRFYNDYKSNQTKKNN
jgi:hypothetical protein